MARTETVAGRMQLLLGAATIAAHSTSIEDGFRQRDVRFLFDLFTNWIETRFVGGVAPIQNTQIARFLQDLGKEGHIKRTDSPMKPQYRLTRVGLLELMTRIVNTTSEHQEEFLFLFYFIKNYRPRLMALIQREGSQFPPSLRIELEALLDPKSLLQREIGRIEREIGKLEQRIRDADATSELTKTKLKRGASLPEIVAEAERRFPYELNSQKPLRELIDSIPADQRQWELETGNRKRCDEIWGPTRQILRAYLAELRKLPLSV